MKYLQISDHSLKFIADVIASNIFGIQVNSFQDPGNHWYSVVDKLKHSVSTVRYYTFLLATFTPHIFNYIKISSVYKTTNEKLFKLVKEVVQYRETNKVTRNDFMQLLIQLKNTGCVSKEDSVSDDYKNSE